MTPPGVEQPSTYAGWTASPPSIVNPTMTPPGVEQHYARNRLRQPLDRGQ